MKEVTQHEPKCRLYVTQTKADLLADMAEAAADMDAQDPDSTAGVPVLSCAGVSQ